MKKLLLAIAAVFILSSSAWAGLIWQPYDARNESYILQTGQVSWALVTQFGDQSKSIINQTGQFDKAVVSQSSSCCSWGHCTCGGSWVGVPLFTETAYENFSLINQRGFGFHDAYVTQLGDGNKSFVNQSGTKDEAKVFQKGGFNYSDIQQTGFGVNTASVTQDGDLNTSLITQNSGLNSAVVDQFGYGNFSKIDQMGYGMGLNTAAVLQAGYMNLSDIKQYGCGSHTAVVSQANFCFTASIPYCK